MPNKLIITSLLHLDAFRPCCQKWQKMVNIDKQEKKLYFDEHLGLVLFSSQISSHCFIYLDLQDFGLLRLRGLPWILQVQSTGFPSIFLLKKRNISVTPLL